VRIARTWGNKWHFYTRCKGGVVGNYYEPSQTFVGALVAYLTWRLGELKGWITRA